MNPMFKQAVEMSGSKNPKDEGYSKLIDILQSRLKPINAPREFVYPNTPVKGSFVPSRMPNVDAGFVPGRSPAVRLGGMEPTENPVWANILFKGIQKRDKLKKGVETLKDDPSLIVKGLLGKSLLDKHINPFFDKIMPDSTKLDVLKKQIQFNPNERFGMTVGDDKLALNWRF